jgi:hypothetical protein
MSLPDGIEFHVGERILLSMESGHAPDRGDLVNIRKVTYRVIGRTYTVDHADEARERQMVCVINLEEIVG